MISVVILSWNNEDTLEATLKSVFNCPPYDKEIIIIDSHSTDNTPNILAKYSSRLKTLYDRGKGIGWARNMGVKHAAHDIIAFLDSDVICAKNHFTALLDCYDSCPEVGAADVRGGHPQIGTKVQRLESLYYDTVETYFSRQITLRGWSISCRRNVFNDVGGFWRGGSDDLDFSYKVRAKGYQVASVEAASFHIPRATLRAIWKEMALWAKNAAYYHYVSGNNWILYQELSKRRIFRLLRNVKAMTVVAYLAAPFTGLKYLRVTKNIDFYFYFIVRHLAYLIGYVRGVHASPKRFKKEKGEIPDYAGHFVT